MLTILFDGIAYGMLLFVLASGLSVTLGLMNFINLAHGSFAMAGAYITVFLVNRLGVPFFLSLPMAFLASAGIGFLFERTLYSHVYRKPHLDQVLFTIGLVFMSVAATDYVMGSSQVFVQIPSYLQGQFDIAGIGVGRYRLLIIVLCGLLTIALQFILAKTLSFPKIISGRIGDAALPRSEWRQWCQTVGLHAATARLSVMPSACALDCNRPHKRKEFSAGAPRRRWPYDPGTRDAMCRSGVPQCRFATGTLARSAGHGYPSPSPDAEISGRRFGHCRAKGRLVLESRETPQ